MAITHDYSIFIIISLNQETKDIRGGQLCFCSDPIIMIISIIKSDKLISNNSDYSYNNDVKWGHREWQSLSNLLVKSLDIWCQAREIIMELQVPLW